MNRQSILIAESSDTFRASLSLLLQGSYDTYTCRNGKEALEIILSVHPDAIVLDMMLTELDGVSLLNRVIVNDYHPAILATTKLMTDYIIRNSDKFKIDYLVCKPCDAEAISQRVQEIITPMYSAGSPSDPETLIKDTLLRLKISQKHKGFDYLMTAVHLTYCKPDIAITKELYPAVASQFRVTGSQVERSIRSAVASAWERGSGDIWKTLFSDMYDDRAERPSNGTFITAIAQEILRRCPLQPDQAQKTQI